MFILAATNPGLRIVCIFLQVYYLILLARVILSWFPNVPDGIRPLVDFVYAVTEPVIRFARPLIPPVRIGAVALDLSILLVFLILVILQRAFC